ncbi:hypothetical protein GCK32_018411, partial [Trichostrongylus colubriformis]
MDPVTPTVTSAPIGNSKRPPKPPQPPGNVQPEKPGTSRKRMPSDENLDAPTVSKKGRASGTLLKELLQQASKTLHLAASKVDDFAPAVVSSSLALEKIECLEQRIGQYEESNKEVLRQLKTAAEGFPNVGQQLSTVLTNTEGTAKASEIMENHRALGIRLDEILHHVREIDEKLDVPDLKKIASEMNLLNNRMAALEKQLHHTSQGSTSAAPVLTPHRSDSRDADDSNRKSVPAQSSEKHSSRDTAHDQPTGRDRHATPHEDSCRAYSKKPRRSTPSRSSHHTRTPRARSRDRSHSSPSKSSRSVQSAKGICRSPTSGDLRRNPSPRRARQTPRSDDEHRTRK